MCNTCGCKKAESFEAEKDNHYYECYFEMFDSNDKSIDSYVWSSPPDLSYSKATELAQIFAKKVAKKGVEPYWPKPNRKVSRIKFTSFKKISADYKKSKKYSPEKYPSDISLDSESFEAEGPRTLTIKGVKYIGDEMQIKIELEKSGKKHTYIGTLHKDSGCVKCGDKIFAQWEKGEDILDLCKQCYLMHFYDAEEFEAPNELIEIDGKSPLRGEKYMDMVLFYVGDRADLRYSHDRMGRPTTERQELGSGDRIRSIINPLGIRMNDIDIIMNSGLPEIMQKPWDGKYILFEEGGTFTTGKPVNYFDSTIEYEAEFYSAEDFNSESFSAEMDCPPATQDVAINTKNRNATIKNFGYGPLNVDEPGDFWEKIAKQWETSVDAAKKSKCGNCVAFDRSPRMKDCMPGETSDGEGVLGYCWMHHFKCHSARTCDTWAKGGPITTDKVSEGWQERAFAKPKASKIDTESGKATAKAAETDVFGDIEDHSDVWTPEREVIQQIKGSRRLMEEFPMISYDSRWDPTKVNEWSPERQTIDEIRGNPMYEEEFSYLGRHPGYYDKNGFWVEKMMPEMYEGYSDVKVPLFAQVGLTIAAITGATFILKKMSK